MSNVILVFLVLIMIAMMLLLFFIVIFGGALMVFSRKGKKESEGLSRGNGSSKKTPSEDGIDRSPRGRWSGGGDAPDDSETRQIRDRRKTG